MHNTGHIITAVGLFLTGFGCGWSVLQWKRRKIDRPIRIVADTTAMERMCANAIKEIQREIARTPIRRRQV